MGYRYIGAKTQIVEEVLQTIERIVGRKAAIADIMCGTATVSSALRSNGYQVFASDVMTYAYHHARVALQFSEMPKFSDAHGFIKKFGGDSQTGLFPPTEYEQVLTALNNVPPVKGYFFREFSLAGKPTSGHPPRNYYTADNAARIDGIRAAISRLKENQQISDLEHSLLIHDLVMAANDVANIAGTYGHYLSKTVGRATVPLRLTPTRLQCGPDARLHKALRGYAEDVASGLRCDLVYIDPPYMKRQYAANYHVLETIARGDEPTAIGLSGLRPWRDQYSNFCTKTKIFDSFRTILRGAKCSHFLVSYSEDGLLSIEQLRTLLREFGKVRTQTIKHKRFKSNDSRLSSTITEYLIHVEKPAGA